METVQIANYKNGNGLTIESDVTDKVSVTIETTYDGVTSRYTNHFGVITLIGCKHYVKGLELGEQMFYYLINAEVYNALRFAKSDTYTTVTVVRDLS